MSTYIDVFLHVIFSLLAAYVAWKAYGDNKKRNLFLSVVYAMVGGVLIDLDHFIDNLLAFGWNFNYGYFITGEYFLKTGKTYVFFHGFEYLIILFVVFFFAKTKMIKMILLSLTLAMAFHLGVDIIFYSIPIKNYFILYRIFNDFKVDMASPLLHL